MTKIGYFLILGTTVYVYCDKDLSEDRYAEFDTDNFRIVVSSKLPQNAIFPYAVHEAFHAFLALTGQANTSFEEWTPEECEEHMASTASTFVSSASHVFHAFGTQ